METVQQIGFEGLGIKPFGMNNVAFTIGENFAVYWYAIIITLGMILAVIFAMKFAPKVGITADNMVDCALWGTPFALIGARLYFILFSLDDFIGKDFVDTLGKMVDIRTGGLAIYGGIIFGFLTGLIVCRIKNIKALAVFDVAALGFLIGQAVGRWGNFVNGEAHGTLCNLPWGMTIDGSGPFHPTFLYESLWNVVGFVLLLLFTLKLRRHRGETFFGYMVWYGVGRAWIESLRTDSLFLFSDGVKKALGLNFNIRVSQLLSIIIAVVGVVLFVLARRGLFDKIAEKHALKREAKRAAKAAANGIVEEGYTPVFMKEESDIAENGDELSELDKIEDAAPEEIDGDASEETDGDAPEADEKISDTEVDNGSDN